MSRPRDPSLAGKTERIDTRVSPATRVALEEAARANGASLSREIEDRLSISLMQDHTGGADLRPEMEGLLSALRLVIERVEELTGSQWKEDAFTRDSVADAVSWLVRFAGPNVDSGTSIAPATFPTTVPEDSDWDLLRRDTADHLIAIGVGRYCAEILVRSMAMPLPDGPLGAQLGRLYSLERNAAKGLRGLLRIQTEESGQ